MNNILKEKSTALLRNLAMGVLVLSGCFFSCSDDVSDDSYFTFTSETMASFCEKQENLSIFSKIMKESDNYTLLSTYGRYTCFVPTDSAFNVYFQEKNITYNDLTIEDKKKILNDHLIRGTHTTYFTENLQEGTIATPNVSNRLLTVAYAVEGGRQVIYINKDSPILRKDNKVHNGVAQIVGRVIEPSMKFLDIVLEEKDYFSLFSQAFNLTHLGDSIQKIADEDYVSPTETGFNAAGDRVPLYKKYGYTIFAETNETFNAAGITNIDQLVSYASKYYGTQDLNDYTSRNNPLNKFISYHMLDRQMSTSSFLYVGKATSANAMDKRFEYYETQLKNRLIEIKSGNKINTLKNGSHVALDDARSNNDGANGFVHALSNILVYDENNMVNDVLNKHIRFDVFSLPPSLTNNNIRWQLVGDVTNRITRDYCDEYLVMNESTQLTLWASDDWANFQTDEMVMSGWYDFTIRMHPVPPGTYEIRFGYRAESWRGIGQTFIDGQIAGIPVDLKILGLDPLVGWVKDGDTQDNGAENDKMMRNRGYMKAPNSIYSLQGGGRTLRADQMALRKIVGTYTFQEYGPHYIRFKNVDAADRQFHCDYIEYIPVSALSTEGID